ncbi:MAG: DUF554 domain-containing protein [Lachnospiraceae bacterium]|nr:DUF554 domain-containing protein [Lachnospiraceae bacterium]
MIGIGTLINTAAVAGGGIAGHFAGRFFTRTQQDAINMACGISVLFIAIAGAMEGMLQITMTAAQEAGSAAAAGAAAGVVSGGAGSGAVPLAGAALTSGHSMFIVLCLALGTALGEILHIEEGFERFGTWLKIRTGNAKDAGFVDAFVTASLTVCVGAMAIVGAIQDGVTGNYSTLAVKSVLDFIIVAVMTSSMGRGCAFSAIPILLFEGSITLLARLIAPFLTAAAISNLSLVGAILIFCVGVNLVWGKKVRVANMLPAVLLAVLAAYLPG